MKSGITLSVSCGGFATDFARASSGQLAVVPREGQWRSVSVQGKKKIKQAGYKTAIDSFYVKNSLGKQAASL